MNTTKLVTTLLLALALLATPAVAQTVSVGALAGPLPPGATVGALRGPIPADATVTTLMGPPAGGTIGAFAGPLPPGATVGAFAGSLPPGATVGAFQGPVPPDATVGAFSGPLPAGATFRTPTPEDTARAQESLAKMHMQDANYREGESLLRRSIDLRTQTVGPEDPSVVNALENNARLLRRYNRGEAASEMEDRAAAIREKQRPASGPPSLLP